MTRQLESRVFMDHVEYHDWIDSDNDEHLDQ